MFYIIEHVLRHMHKRADIARAAPAAAAVAATHSQLSLEVLNAQPHRVRAIAEVTLTLARKLQTTIAVSPRKKKHTVDPE